MRGVVIGGGTYTTKVPFFNLRFLCYRSAMSAQHKVRSSHPTAVPETPARPRHAALSVPRGTGTAAKDFDWLRLNLPCQAACPAGTDIPGYLEAIAQGDYAAAYRINLEDNVFPAVLGRVCTRPCEPACRHGWKGLGEPVAICFSKRSAADFQGNPQPVVLEKLFPSSGKRVVVVGGGASGLAAARDLARYGHAVTVLERHAEAGGMMVQGIPPFRLPRELVRREIGQITALGVELRCGVAVESAEALQEQARGYDAIVIATGTTQPNRPDLPGMQAAGVQHGLEFLRALHAGTDVAVGRQVVVIGGGFTAVDCARTARRRGAEKVTMFYRRTVDDLYITPGEVEEMAREGIEFVPQCSPQAILENEGHVRGIRFIRTRPGPAEAGGRKSFLPVAGSEFEVAADTVLLGTGQTAQRQWLPQPLPENIFLAGDVASGAKSLIEAIAGGRTCARKVDAFLMGRARLREVVEVTDAASTGRTRELDAVPRQPMPVRAWTGQEPAAEVELGYSEQVAQTEAKRCYFCHYKFEIDNELCIYCDRCLKVKPVEGCIVKVREMTYDEAGRITGYRPSTGARDYNLLYIDQSQCIRCGACRDVCPVACIDLQKVRARSVCVS